MSLGNVYEVLVNSVQKVELSCVESFFAGLCDADADETTTSRLNSGRIYNFDLNLSYAVVKGVCQRAGDLFSGSIKFQVRKDLESKVLDELPDVAPSLKNNIFLSKWA